MAPARVAIPEKMTIADAGKDVGVERNSYT